MTVVETRPPIVVIANSLNSYAREIIAGLSEAGVGPDRVYLGSRAERFLFKLDSFRAAVRQVGLWGALHRVAERRRSTSGARGPMAYAVEVPHLLYDRINEGRLSAELLAIGRPILVLAGAGIVDSALLSAARGGCVNGHPALLPGIRGVDVVEWALLEGRPVGVSAHLVVPKVDAGPILRTCEVSPLPGEEYEAYHRRIVEVQAQTLVAAVADLAQGRVAPIPNDLAKCVLRFRMNSSLRRQAQHCFTERVRRISSSSLPPS